MANIDISTSQQVDVAFEVADVRDRILAFIIDMILLVVVYLVLMFLSLELLGTDDGPLLYLILYFIAAFYSLIAELLMNGQSPGKRAMAIRVVNRNGLEPTMTDYMIRWSFRLIDIWLTLGVVAIMLISAGGKGQRLGDVVAGTCVIRTQNRYTVRLEQLEQMQNAEGYVATYPTAVQCSEAEMLLVKEVLDRSRRFRNKAHREALEMTAEKISRRMNLSSTPSDKRLFLTQVLQDYVALSR